MKITMLLFRYVHTIKDGRVLQKFGAINASKGSFQDGAYVNSSYSLNVSSHALNVLLFSITRC